MLTLKAIGNAGKAFDYNVLLQCAKESRNSAEVRVAAMQAFRRVSCGVNVSLSFILKNIKRCFSSTKVVKLLFLKAK